MVIMSGNTQTESGIEASNQRSTVEVSGDVGSLFEDGELRSASEVKQTFAPQPTSLEEWCEVLTAGEVEEMPTTLEEWLDIVAPGKLDRVDEVVDEFPDATREDLIERQVVNIVEEAKEAGHHMEGGEVELTYTHRQAEQPPKEGDEEWLDLTWLPESVQKLRSKECPASDCDSTNISSYQQQTGGADEGMTGFHECQECGNNWRTGYGS